MPATDTLWPYAQLLLGLGAVLVVTWLVVRRVDDGGWTRGGRRRSRPDRSSQEPSEFTSRRRSSTLSKRAEPTGEPSAAVDSTGDAHGSGQARVIW